MKIINRQDGMKLEDVSGGPIGQVFGGFDIGKRTDGKWLIAAKRVLMSYPPVPVKGWKMTCRLLGNGVSRTWKVEVEDCGEMEMVGDQCAVEWIELVGPEITDG